MLYGITVSRTVFRRREIIRLFFSVRPPKSGNPERSKVLCAISGPFSFCSSNSLSWTEWQTHIADR